MKAISEDAPWLAPSVIEWLEAILNPNWTVLETGAGGSTVFFAQRVKHVVTFEHDLHWAREVNRRLKERHLTNVHMRIFPSYPTAGIGQGTWPVDLAFIDGRGRVRSVIDVLPRIRSGGWLVLDDSQRERYREAHRVADPCGVKRVFQDGSDETTVWRKD